MVWDRTGDTAQLSLPPPCIDQGAYGELRFAVLTEIDGADADYAPDAGQDGVGHSRWIPRG